MPEKVKNIKQQIFRILEKSKRPLNYKQVAKKIKFLDKNIILQILDDLVKQKKLELNDRFKFFIKPRAEQIKTGYVEIIKKNVFFKDEFSGELVPLVTEKGVSCQIYKYYRKA